MRCEDEHRAGASGLWAGDVDATHSRVHKGVHCGTGGIAHVRVRLNSPSSCGERSELLVCAGRGGSVTPSRRLSCSGGSYASTNCFKRASSTTKTGNHIGLISGSQYYSEIIHAKAGGHENHGGNLFGRAHQVWFWILG